MEMSISFKYTLRKAFVGSHFNRLEGIKNSFSDLDKDEKKPASKSSISISLFVNSNYN